MTQQGPDHSDSVPGDSWPSTGSSSMSGGSLSGGSLSGGSLSGGSSLDDAREAAERDQVAPNPFSREAAPDEALGTDSPPPAPAVPPSPVAEPGPPPVTMPTPQTWTGYPAGPPPDNTAAPQYPAPNATPTYGYDSGAGGYGNNHGGYGSAAGPYDPAQPYGAPAGYPQTPEYGANPYQVNPYQPAYGSSSAYGAVPLTHPQSTLSLILGILGVTLCPLAGIPGLFIASRARKQIDAEPQRYSGRGLATAGFVLGIFSILATVFWVIIMTLGLSGAFDS